MKKQLVIILFYCVTGLAVLAAATGLGIFYWASRDLPNLTRITDYKPALVTTVYAHDKQVLGYFYKEKRFLVSLEEVSPHLIQAFLAVEDDDFYRHKGVDFMAIFRAFIRNLQAGYIVQGGSTITQQLVKRLVLTPERSYKRKLQEALLAYRLEKNLKKNDILTIYLNQIFFGARAYGVEAAARTYFGRHAKDLTLAQAAILAALPNAPSKTNPYRNPQDALQRKTLVLKRMLELGMCSEAEYETAMAEPLELAEMDDPSWKTGAYYLEEVRRRLIDMYGEDAVYYSGLHVYTAVDMKHQQAAEKALRKGLEASARRRGWTGPEKTLKEEEYQTFLAQFTAPGQGTTPKDPARILQAGQWIEVLVEKVSKQKAQVAFGPHKGQILAKDLAWARPPDPAKAPESVPPVTDCTRVLKPGDVVWASVLKVPSAFAKPVAAQQKAPPTGKKDSIWSLALERRPAVEGALVSLEPPTGQVRALVGGYDFHRSQFNRATQAHRQPGSAFKPLVYSAALDNGLTPSSILMDAPIVYNDYQNDRTWKPENFEGVFHGPTLLRTALVKSRNLVTIRIAQRIGIETIISRAKTMGLEGDFPADLSVSLGSGVVTPLNLAQAYTVFARGGSYIKPQFILQVDTSWGQTLFTAEPEVHGAISAQTAYVIVNLLREVVRDGTGWRARKLLRPVAAKTGTSNDEQDAWFAGFTPDLLSLVYVGFDKLQPMGRFETGSRAASPIWLDYRLAVEKDYPVRNFTQPAGITMVRIDAATGKLAAPASEETYTLAYKTGSQPTETAAPNETMQSSKKENILKEIF